MRIMIFVLLVVLGGCDKNPTAITKVIQNDIVTITFKLIIGDSVDGNAIDTDCVIPISHEPTESTVAYVDSVIFRGKKYNVQVVGNLHDYIEAPDFYSSWNNLADSLQHYKAFKFTKTRDTSFVTTFCLNVYRYQRVTYRYNCEDYKEFIISSDTLIVPKESNTLIDTVASRGVNRYRYVY